MPIKLNTASGGGVVLTGANTASDKTITVPAVDGTMIYADSSGNMQFNSGYGSVATAYGCRAWVNFNGTGTVAIRASGNVTSITDNGVGDYTVNFSVAMPDANYTPQLTGYLAGAGNEGEITVQSYSSAPTTSAFRLVNGVPGTNGSTAFAARDSAYLNAAFFR